MSEMGMAMMGTGCASGPNRAREATEAAIRNPLLEDVNLQGARGILSRKPERNGLQQGALTGAIAPHYSNSITFGDSKGDRD
jgi:hypothetical protein